jgi:hypothetical protein
VLLLLSTMIGLGLIAGFLARGTLKGLKDIHFRIVWMLFLSVIVGLLPLFSDSLNSHRHVLQLISYAGVLAFLIVNILTSRGEVRVGMLVIMAGWALNFIVIAANHGMPLSRWAYAASGQTSRITQGSGGFYRIVVAGPHTKLLRLGDVIPVKPYSVVVSIGDIVLSLGIAFVIAAVMRTARRGSPAEQPAQ